MQEIERKSHIHLSQLASVGQIAAGIAHEVRNPLTAVKGFLQLLKEKNDATYIEIAERELEDAITTLQNLLQVSKPDLEDEPFESINLSVELENLLPLFQDQIYRVQIVKDFKDTDSYVYGKKNQLKKALFNLLKNAFEAIPDKGTIVLGHEVQDDYVVIYIQDSGSGIPKEKLDLLGTPFFTTKDDGTGMGLTHVFSVVYQHNGSIDVESRLGEGTKFTITIPKETGYRTRGVFKMDLQFMESQTMKEFFLSNKAQFEERLLNEAINVRDKINEILEVGNINLLSNALKLVLYVVDEKHTELISFARAEGVAWAKVSLTLAFKLEWIQAIRRVLWDFLYNYSRLSGTLNDGEYIYALEKTINELIDQFLNNFFISYSQYKDDLIRMQREMVEGLSVPIIPLTPSISILPLIGTLDLPRLYTIQDKVLHEIGTTGIETIIFDLSGTAEMDSDNIRVFLNTLDGVKMMGCTAVITGIRSTIVKTMIQLGLTFENRAVTKGTLQQALVDYLR
ncbi:ATP-binding protein [Paenibacillus thermotolerans]|uniref:ATP-binding protein n=1 Tax=Paenibacillus thermotolerans TaxID=3027807 RepID=UPI0023674C04|nr:MULTISPECIES: ATP-binding protein [unclassified Paenibacillus]